MTTANDVSHQLISWLDNDHYRKWRRRPKRRFRASFTMGEITEMDLPLFGNDFRRLSGSGHGRPKCDSENFEPCESLDNHGCSLRCDFPNVISHRPAPESTWITYTFWEMEDFSIGHEMPFGCFQYHDSFLRPTGNSLNKICQNSDAIFSC